MQNRITQIAEKISRRLRQNMLNKFKEEIEEVDDEDTDTKEFVERQRNLEGEMDVNI